MAKKDFYFWLLQPCGVRDSEGRIHYFNQGDKIESELLITDRPLEYRDLAPLQPQHGFFIPIDLRRPAYRQLTEEEAISMGDMATFITLLDKHRYEDPTDWYFKTPQRSYFRSDEDYDKAVREWKRYQPGEKRLEEAPSVT